MQVKVPKFIEIEDRVVFGLTWRQVLYLGSGIGAAFFFLIFLAPVLAFPLGATAVGFGAAFAFAKVNERPFKLFFAALWRYHTNPRRYFWKKEEAGVARTAKREEAAVAPEPKRVTRERLREIAEALDARRRAGA